MRLDENILVIPESQNVPEVRIVEFVNADKVVFVCPKHECMSEVSIMDFQEMLHDLRFYGSGKRAPEFFRQNLGQVIDYFNKKHQYINFTEGS
jgi:hypothetical protein